MKTAAKLFLIALALAGSLSAQNKVAEGEYQLSQSDPGHPQRWVLTARPSGGYLLRSEIQIPANGIRVLQLEELNDRLVPISIGYELYLKDHTEPNVFVKCALNSDSITCDGKSEKGTAERSKPYRYKGPFLFSISDLAQFDFAWLASGALNMAHLTDGKTPLRTIRVGGGAALELTDDINIAAVRAVMTPNQKFTAIRPENYTQWEFISDDDDQEMLTFIGVEQVQLSGAQVAVRHYSLAGSDERTDFWVADPGVLLKMSIGSDAEYVLANYHQYVKLIPEIKVETIHGD